MSTIALVSTITSAWKFSRQIAACLWAPPVSCCTLVDVWNAKKSSDGFTCILTTTLQFLKGQLYPLHKLASQSAIESNKHKFGYRLFPRKDSSKLTSILHKTVAIKILKRRLTLVVTGVPTWLCSAVLQKSLVRKANLLSQLKLIWNID